MLRYTEPSVSLGRVRLYGFASYARGGTHVERVSVDTMSRRNTSASLKTHGMIAIRVRLHVGMPSRQWAPCLIKILILSLSQLYRRRSSELSL